MSESVEMRDQNQGLGPRSVSQYDDFNDNAAFDALKDASQKLLPLADYIENNFVPAPSSSKDRAHHAEG